MEFWGVEVKSGEVVKVNPGDGMVLRLSQACLGEMKKKKGSESVVLSLNVDGKQLVLGTLFTDKLPQQQFDIVFDRYFELSHSWKSGSVYFCGYRAENPVDDDDEYPVQESDDYYTSDSEEDDFPLIVAENGIEKQVKAVENEKAYATNGKDSDASKQKVKIVEPEKAVERAGETSDDDTSDSDTSDGETSDGESSDGETSDDDLMSEDEDDEEGDGDDESDDSDEETPQKAVPNKKRAGDSAIETPVPEKKAKVTPQQTDGKKVVTHVDTPRPSKKMGKKITGGKLTSVPEKPLGAYSCGSCNKTFNSDQGLESHNKAKHTGGK